MPERGIQKSLKEQMTFELGFEDDSHKEKGWGKRRTFQRENKAGTRQEGERT